MSKTRVAGRTIALGVLLELVVGAAIWFSHSPSADAQPSQPAAGSAATAITPGSAAPTASAGDTAPTATPADAAKPADSTKPADAKTACPPAVKKKKKQRDFETVAKEDLLPIAILIVV